MPVKTRSQTALKPKRSHAGMRQRTPNDLERTAQELADDNLESSLVMPHIPVHYHVSEDPSTSGEEPSVSFNNLGSDKRNVILLMFLYVLQGIPLGLAGAIPLILQGRNVSYKEQALFSFVFWPFSVKLLWAPIEDSLYIKRFGRRKSWLIPCQYCIGMFMLVLSLYIDEMLGTPSNPNPVIDVKFLTFVFFSLNFFAASQDIAVDGWALTMLKRVNVGWASTCNSVGQTAGYFLGNALFLSLESADFCNAYLRRQPQPTGMVTLAGFLWFWGFVFLFTTTIVAIFKREAPEVRRERSEEAGDVNDCVSTHLLVSNHLIDDELSTDGDTQQGATGDKPDLREPDGVISTYLLLYRIIRLPSVFSLIIIHLTIKIGFAATDGITGLKLLEAGLPKENLALLAMPLIPLNIVLPLVISRFTAGPKPLDIMLKAYPYRLMFGIVFAWVVWITPSAKLVDGKFPIWFYSLLLLVIALQQVTLYSMFVAVMAFHAKISDPMIGGTYMTLLNTVANLGGNWPVTIALSCVDFFTFKTCSLSPRPVAAGAESAGAATSGGADNREVCETVLDGYYILSLIGVVVGVVWYIIMRRRVHALQNIPPSQWRYSRPVTD